MALGPCEGSRLLPRGTDAPHCPLRARSLGRSRCDAALLRARESCSCRLRSSASPTAGARVLPVQTGPSRYSRRASLRYSSARPCCTRRTALARFQERYLITMLPLLAVAFCAGSRAVARRSRTDGAHRRRSPRRLDARSTLILHGSRRQARLAVPDGRRATRAVTDHRRGIAARRGRRRAVGCRRRARRVQSPVGVPLALGSCDRCVRGRYGWSDFARQLHRGPLPGDLRRPRQLDMGRPSGSRARFRARPPGRRSDGFRSPPLLEPRPRHRPANAPRTHTSTRTATARRQSAPAANLVAGSTGRQGRGSGRGVVRSDRSRRRATRPPHARRVTLAPASRCSRCDAHGRDGTSTAGSTRYAEIVVWPRRTSAREGSVRLRLRLLPGLPNAVDAVTAPGFERRVVVRSTRPVKLFIPFRAEAGPIRIALRGQTAFADGSRTVVVACRPATARVQASVVKVSAAILPIGEL